jgi:uncharacterized protein (DUF433 family)
MTTPKSVGPINIDPRICKGRAYIVATTVTVADVAIALNYHGLDAAGIAEWYDLTLPQTDAALAYYNEHRTEIDEQIERQIAIAEALLIEARNNANQSWISSAEMRERLAKRGLDLSQLPPP